MQITNRTDPFGRRDFLRIGSLGSVGVSLAGVLKGAGAPRRDTSCILIWQSGGVSHLDTFDMKPGAPREIRGEFKAIRTNVPGMQICEHLPYTAKQADKFTILRSLCSGETNHERAADYLLSGHRGSPSTEPARISSVVSKEFGKAAIAETTLRERCQTARRLVEEGVRLVTVSTGWLSYDTHADNFSTLKNVLPQFDQAFAGLLEDLHLRGMLETTLVVAMGEFGRTPKINDAGGRDHHANAWSIALAGAGIGGGRVLGATDRTGSEVTDLPVSPEDLLFTIYAILGVESPTAGGKLIPGLIAS